MLENKEKASLNSENILTSWTQKGKKKRERALQRKKQMILKKNLDLNIKQLELKKNYVTGKQRIQQTPRR